MNTKTLCFDDLAIDFSKREMQGNGMAGNGIEAISTFDIENLLSYPKEIGGNGI